MTTQGSALEFYMLDLINEERAANGRTPLKLEQNLNQSAEDHSLWMIDSNIFSHTGAGNSSAKDRMEAANFTFSGSWASGENIGFQSERGAPGLMDDVEDIHDRLMLSSGHRWNILNTNYDYVGIGIEYGNHGGYNGVMITQNFAKTSAPVILDNAGGSPNPPVPPVIPEPPAVPEPPMSDVITGTNGNDTLNGTGGDDVIEARAGRDVVNGGAGDDIIRGGGGNDVLSGDGGNDTIWGGNGLDRLIGGDGADVLRGGNGRDRINGGAGNDSLHGGDGADTIWGDGNDDWLAGQDGNDVLRGGKGNDSMSGGDGEDIMYGGSHHDTMSGNADDDYMNGGSGNDALYGGNGNDVLQGGKGDDALYGMRGADRFVFEAGMGRDVVHDFEDGQDVLDFSALNFASLGAVMARAEAVGNDVVFDLGGGDEVLIENASLFQVQDDIFF